MLDAVQKGLDAVVVHPSGILGPYDLGRNHLVQMIQDYMDGELPACVQGGYDLVDVRDVAAGCLAAAGRGRRGECYLLSNRRYELSALFELLQELYGGRKLPVLSQWTARLALPFLAGAAKIRGQRPLYTKYALDTLESPCIFSNEKAQKELGFHPRPLKPMVRDTAIWLKAQHPQWAAASTI